MKTPKFLSKLSAVLTPRPRKRLNAATAARPSRRAMDSYDEEEPTTRLSSAFIVVLILHVVAVGGIYAFNSIKASRKDREMTTQTTDPAPPAPIKTSATDTPAIGTQPVHQTALPTHATESAPVPALASPKPASGNQYQVKAGDNLTKIAFAYKVTPADIMEANHLKEGTVLHPGQTLTIPEGKTVGKTAANAHKTDATPKQTDVAPTSTTPGFYTVKKGDTATSIAHSYGLTTEELLKANRITDPKKLQPGQTLKVPPRKN
jgi:LysM repeat protein